MALDASVVELATAGRLDRDDTETQRQLDAALAAARSYCGWHVTPSVPDAEITIDGPGGPLLMIPTLNMTALSSLTEDGTDVDVAALSWSRRGMVLKRHPHLLPPNQSHYLPWNWWTDWFQGITVVVTHGYDNAPDFEAAVLSAIARGAFSAVDTVKAIGPFQYDTSPVASSGTFTQSELSQLDKYALERRP